MFNVGYEYISTLYPALSLLKLWIGSMHCCQYSPWFPCHFEIFAEFSATWQQWLVGERENPPAEKPFFNKLLFIPQVDMTLGGYHVPAGTFVMWMGQVTSNQVSLILHTIFWAPFRIHVALFDLQFFFHHLSLTGPPTDGLKYFRFLLRFRQVIRIFRNLPDTLASQSPGGIILRGVNGMSL